jgi:ABC-2 type transport system permease protein
LFDSESSLRSERIALLPLVEVGRNQGAFTGTAQSVKEIWDRRELLGLLVRRELKARYKNSSLGLVWSLMRPLSQLLIYYFAVGQIIGLARAVPDFAIFVFVGLTAWTLFSEIVSNSTTSIISNQGLVKKVYLPREIFPLASVGSALFGFLVQFIVLLAAVVVLGRFPMTWDILYAAGAFVMLVTFATALGVLLAGLTVYARDLEHLVEVVLAVLFWASPIVYSYSFVRNAIGGSTLEQIYLANPITIGVLGFQRGLWIAGSDPANSVTWPPDMALRMAAIFVLSVIFLWFSQRIFSRLQGNFAQEL